MLYVLFQIRVRRRFVNTTHNVFHTMMEKPSAHAMINALKLKIPYAEQMDRITAMSVF